MPPTSGSYPAVYQVSVIVEMSSVEQHAAASHALPLHGLDSTYHDKGDSWEQLVSVNDAPKVAANTPRYPVQLILANILPDQNPHLQPTLLILTARRMALGRPSASCPTASARALACSSKA